MQFSTLGFAHPVLWTPAHPLDTHISGLVLVINRRKEINLLNMKVLCNHLRDFSLWTFLNLNFYYFAVYLKVQ